MNSYKSKTWLIGAICVALMTSCITITRTPRETDLGSHHVTVVPNCQHASTNSHRQYELDGSSKVLFYEFNCGETIVRLDGDSLTVNGKSYGVLNDGDTIAVSFGNVLVNSTARAAK